jgi:2'-hydroxyisoflavone reductase
VVGAAAALLREAAGHYTFISSCSVYADASRRGLDETAPVAVLDDPAIEVVTGGSYGGLKALCERVCSNEFGDRAVIVRAGLIVGPNDYMDRFAYWPRRVAAGGDVLAPGRPDAPVQLIDVRDLAAWIVRGAESGLGGTYNATGPAAPLTIGDVLATCRSATGSDARFVWVDEAFLLEHEVAAYSEMPLWVPAEAAGFNTFDCRRALAAGLACRPLDETIRDTWEWDRPRTPEQRRYVGPIDLPGPMTGEREAGLLARWRERAVAGS